MDNGHRSTPLRGLADGITSRTLEVRDLDVHILEAGPRDAPLILLLHGFPELAFSWRSVILPLTHLGYHVVAPDARGYGRTKPHDPAAAQRPIEYEDDLRPYRQLNLVHDVVALVFALGHTSVAALVGHDFGSTLTGNCAFVRPDLFRAVVFMSAPYTGPLPLPFASDPSLRTATDSDSAKKKAQAPVSPAALVAYAGAMLALLDPPRKHYMQYFCGPGANADIMHAPQGLRAFLRGYFHAKSGDWVGDDPHPIAPTPEAIASLPHYYIMPAAASMADVARAHAPTEEEVKAKSNGWLPEPDLEVYAEEYGRTGFQGGLNWYRGLVAKEEFAEELSVFSGRRIEVPAMYLAGKKDWGVYQFPGALDKLRKEVCTRMDDEDVVLIEGAGHWVQQEKAEEVVRQIKRFLGKYE